jgi:hypothetical protein
MRFRAFHAFIVLSCATLLGGCYILTEPIFDKGVHAPLAGVFNCKGMMGNKAERFTENKSGFLFFGSYSYEASDGSIFVLSHIKDRFYVAQITGRDRKIAVAFADFLTDRKLLLLVPDLMSKGPYIEQLAKQNNVQAAGAGEPGTIRLIGSKTNVAAFVRAHDRSLLAVVAECDRL